ncbi:MAG TPA: nucleotidyltransferase family protein [Longimicrobiaceae bacterium]|nr:nucleotidyltransferase family protein [Longimicrobiaceae bacterium]
MLLAAGLGTRLRPLTNRIPKALVEIDGVPILEIVARRLIAAGADRLIINTHHLGEQIEQFVADRNSFGIEVAFSPEPDQPLETGGGLLAAAHLLRRSEPFFLHNTDILTDFPLNDMRHRHLAASPLATLAVMERVTSRYLLFDDEGLLGRTDERKGLDIRARDAIGEVRKLAFGGVHIISSEFLDAMTERGAFSILDPYLRLAGEGARILPYRIDDYRWRDIGKPEQLEAAQGWRG